MAKRRSNTNPAPSSDGRVEAPVVACSLEVAVIQGLDRYFTDLEGAPASGVYDMVIRTVERPMLEVVMRQAGGNQLRAADILGINRNTLRKKLQQHGLASTPSSRPDGI